MIRNEYKFITDQEYINNFLTTFAKPEDITPNALQNMFSSNPKWDNNHKKILGVTPPKYYTSDEFILKANTLANQPEEIQTTFGLYLFNLLVIVGAFGHIIPYINNGISDNALKDLQQSLSNLLIADKITVDQYIQFEDNFMFLGYKATLWAPGMSYDFIRQNPVIEAEKKRLIKIYEAAVAQGADPIVTYVDNVETPLIKLAKEVLQDDPQWPYYERGGKPEFGNVFKETVIGLGPVFDPVTGKYTIIQESLSEGVPKEKLDVFANILISSSYARAVGTQDGGAKTKLIFSAMQSIKATQNGKRGTDCHTKRYIVKKITKDNVKANLYNFIIDDSKKQLIRLTYDNAKDYIGKTVKMRSVLFCEDEDYCNMCLGDYFYELGIKNIGNTATKISSKLMNMSLKAMHNAVVTTVKIDPFKYITKL
jgi:hypothetical protein